MSEIRNKNQPTWADIEVTLATEIVEESKKKMVHCMDCDSRRTGGEQPCVDCRRNEMKEYMLIAVCMLAGKYVDVPIWLNIFFGISAAWAVRQMKAYWQ